MKSASIKKSIKKSCSGWLFITPMVLGICFFTLYPIFQSFYYSFFDYDYVSKFDFVGFANFKRVFTDKETVKVIRNTLYFAVLNIPVVMIGSYMLALFLNIKIKGAKVLTVLYYLPCVVPAIVGGTVWSYLLRYNPDYPGLINTFLSKAGFPMQKFFYSDNSSAIVTIVIMNLWTLGGGIIIWLAQFKNIPKQLYESVEMDGGGAFRRFITITLPMSTPMVFYNLVTMLVITLQFYGTLTFAPNGGRGIDNSVFMYGLKIYHEAFRRYNIGFASALAWVLIVVVGMLTGLLFKTNKWVQYDNV